MSGAGGFEGSLKHDGDKVYNRYGPLQYREVLLQQYQFMQNQQEVLQQKQLPMESVNWEFGEAWEIEGGKTSENDALSTALSGKTPPLNGTYLDRLMEAVTPIIPLGSSSASEVNSSGSKTQNADSVPFYYFEDMCAYLMELSAYGAGVQFSLDGDDIITQYYSPTLSGIQLYADPSKPLSHLREPGQENSLSNRWSSCSKADISGSPGWLFLEYLEYKNPWQRLPLTDKLSALQSRYPDLGKCKSSDLLPSSWMCVAWYPIYSIPVGSLGENLDAAFLTFHTLSTRTTSKFPPLFEAPNASKGSSIADSSSLKISLPVFALASYKFKDSILCPREPHECEQETALFKSAESWLQHLHVTLPDFNFFLQFYRRPVSDWKVF